MRCAEVHNQLFTRIDCFYAICKKYIIIKKIVKLVLGVQLLTLELLSLQEKICPSYFHLFLIKFVGFSKYIP